MWVSDTNASGFDPDGSPIFLITLVRSSRAGNVLKQDDFFSPGIEHSSLNIVLLHASFLPIALLRKLHPQHAELQTCKRFLVKQVSMLCLPRVQAPQPKLKSHTAEVLPLRKFSVELPMPKILITANVSSCESEAESPPRFVPTEEARSMVGCALLRSLKIMNKIASFLRLVPHPFRPASSADPQPSLLALPEATQSNAVTLERPRPEAVAEAQSRCATSHRLWALRAPRTHARSPNRICPLRAILPSRVRDSPAAIRAVQ